MLVTGVALTVPKRVEPSKKLILAEVGAAGVVEPGVVLVTRATKVAVLPSRVDVVEEVTVVAVVEFTTWFTTLLALLE